MITYNVDSDGIATITWDMPNRTMNVLNEASITAYAGALETALKDDKVKGIIVTSAKADFIAGADLEMLLGADTSDQRRAPGRRLRDLPGQPPPHCCRQPARQGRPARGQDRPAAGRRRHATH